MIEFNFSDGLFEQIDVFDEQIIAPPFQQIDGEKITLSAGESILIEKGARVRYSNPFEDVCEYLAICLPAFSMDLVNREAE